jgi:hypothetical protein
MIQNLRTAGYQPNDHLMFRDVQDWPNSVSAYV